MFREVSTFVLFSQINFFVFVKQILFFWTFYQHSIAQKIWFRLCQTSEQVYRKLQHGEKIFAKFQSMPHFRKKIVLCSLTKFGIVKTATNIPWLKNLNLRLLHTSKKVYRKLQYTETVFGKFQRLPHFSRKVVLKCVAEILHLWSFYQHKNAQKVRFILLAHSKSSLYVTPTWKKNIH